MKNVQVSRAGAVIGQFEPTEVRQGLTVGKFLATDHYWTSGMKGWMPLSQFNEGSAGSITSSASKPKAGKRMTGWLYWRVALVPDKFGYAEWTNRFAVAFLCSFFLMPFCVLFYRVEQMGAGAVIYTPPSSEVSEAHPGKPRSLKPVQGAQKSSQVQHSPQTAKERPAVAIDTKESWNFEEIKAKAEAGDASARFMMGRYFAEVSPSLDESFSWHYKAAMQGHELAQVAVSAAFYLGKGAPKDEIEAYAFWSIAALRNEDARRSLMSMLEHGWLSQEARMKGTKRAEQLLGEIRAGQLLNVAGPTPQASKPPVVLGRPAQPIAVSRASSFEEIKAAAEQGDMMAQFILGDYYSLPVGDIVRDDYVGFSWYLKAARQGLLAAQVKVRTQYSTGMGTKKDYVEAYAWAIVATAGGDEASVKASRDIYLYNLSDAEKRLASRRTEQLSNEIAAEWDARKRRAGK